MFSTRISTICSAARVLSSPGNLNLFAGINAGTANTSGSLNAFFGRDSGSSNTSGAFNSFFGWNAGHLNTTGDSNSFFGTVSGSKNADGTWNSFFGSSSGTNNTSGNFNSFFGVLAGGGNISGSNNSFFGENAGHSNTTGSSNTALGYQADLGSAALTNATAIGSESFVSQSDSLVLGSINGVNGAIADTKVGIGVSAPTFKLQVVDASNTGLRVQTNTAGGTVASFGGIGTFGVDAPGTAGGRFTVLEITATPALGPTHRQTPSFRSTAASGSLAAMSLSQTQTP